MTWKRVYSVGEVLLVFFATVLITQGLFMLMEWRLGV